MQRRQYAQFNLSNVMAPILCLTQATNMNRKMFDPPMGVQQSGVLYHVIAG